MSPHEQVLVRVRPSIIIAPAGKTGNEWHSPNRHRRRDIDQLIQRVAPAAAAQWTGKWMEGEGGRPAAAVGWAGGRRRRPLVGSMMKNCFALFRFLSSAIEIFVKGLHAHTLAELE